MKGFTFRPARAEDGRHFPQLIDEIGTLEKNTGYCYVLMAKMFHRTCAVVEHDGRMVGFLMGFAPPERPDTIFVWQVGVSPKMRGEGLATGLLLQVVRQTGAAHLEASVGVSNVPSRALFEGFAQRLGVSCIIEPCFLPEHFPEEHEAEPLFRIGPLTLDTSAFQRLAARYEPVPQSV